MHEYSLYENELILLKALWESNMQEHPSDILEPAHKKQLKIQGKPFEKARHVLSRLQNANYLQVDNCEVVLSEDLARVLMPVCDNVFSIHRQKGTVNEHLLEADRNCFVTKNAGITLIRLGRMRNRLTWYPTIESCYPDFIKYFELGKISRYDKDPFKICQEAQLINDMMEAHKLKERATLESYAASLEITLTQWDAIMKAFDKCKKAMSLHVIRQNSNNPGEMSVDLLLDQQLIMKLIKSADEYFISLESLSSENLWNQITSFEGR